MDISKIKPDYTLKYIIVGNQAVGKSNIIYRFTQNKFDPQYKATINLDFSYKNIKVKDKIFRIQLWDTVGQESFQSISRGYYKSGVCALVVYDITERESFNDVSNWIEECKNNGPSTISLVLVGNKIDLENERQVSHEEGEEFASRNNMLFFETSALSGKNIDLVFNDSVEAIDRKIESGYYKDKDCGIEFNKQNSGNANAKLNQDNKGEKKKKRC